ncbi:MAG: hypothetical protein A2V86_16430 [Deltaproteobacteria bacterium RBG_16_49_23]|nr:MAG: hypothetical protein A2V86_16430 [Deltaproteobacteria bacterium RBG_16_49_23]
MLEINSQTLLCKNLCLVRDFARNPAKSGTSGSYFLVAATFRLRFRVDITLEADTQAKAFGYHLFFPNHRQSFVDIDSLRA